MSKCNQLIMNGQCSYTNITNTYINKIYKTVLLSVFTTNGAENDDYDAYIYSYLAK